MTNEHKAQKPELLSRLKARLILAGYAQPARPSEVAKALEMPANAVHYWTRRLHEEGHLELLEERGRVRTYRSVAQDVPCELEACAPFVQGALNAISQVVMGAAQKHDLAASESDRQGLLPAIGIHELKLRPADVAKVVEAFQAALPETGAHEEGNGQAYTVSFIVAPGRVSDHF